MTDDTFETSVDFLGRNAAGAMRCFAALRPLYVPDPERLRQLPFSLQIMAQHALKSGVHCIFRIWDPHAKSKSIDKIIKALRSDDIRKGLEGGLRERMFFANVFGGWALNVIDSDSDQAAYDIVRSSICKDYESHLKSPDMKVMLVIRNKMLAHSDGVSDADVGGPLQWTSIEGLLRGTLTLVTKILWLAKNECTDYNSVFDQYSDDAVDDWKHIAILEPAT